MAEQRDGAHLAPQAPEGTTPVRARGPGISGYGQQHRWFPREVQSESALCSRVTPEPASSVDPHSAKGRQQVTALRGAWSAPLTRSPTARPAATHWLVGKRF